MADSAGIGVDIDARTIERYRLPGYTGVVVLDDAGCIRYISADFEGFLDFRLDELIGASFAQVVHGDDAVVAANSFAGVLDRAGYHQALEIRLQNGDRTQLVDVVADNRLSDPEIQAVLLNLADPTDRRRSAQLLDRQAEIVRQIALGDSLAASVAEVLGFVELALPGFRAAAFFVDESGEPTCVSKSVDRTVIEAAAAAMAVDPSLPGAMALSEEETIIAVDLDHPRWLSARRLFGGDVHCVWSVPIRFDRGSETLGCVEIYGPRPLHPRGEDWPMLSVATRLVAVAIDHARLQASLIREADIDHLTSTPNRRVVTAQLAGMLARGESGRAVCFIDLDRLKVVNDALGHEAGDLLICEAASRLTSAVGLDGFVGRFGGDEFVAIANSDDVDCDEFAQRCLDAFDEPILVGGRGWQMSASVGAVVIDDQTTPSEVLRDADTAMYESKRAGRGRWTRFDSASRAAAIRRMQLEQALGDAVRGGLINAWFQPVVHAADWSLVGVEALARWEIEAGSWVPPTEFVPLAEELGLIDELGDAMLRQAIAARDLLAPHLPELGVVSVNLSPLQVRSDRFFLGLDQLAAERVAAGRRGLPPICFEMTEQQMIDDVDGSLTRLERLAEFDTGLAVDDFGSGYSSLARLHRMRADVLKIDQSLVGEYGTPSGTALLHAVVGVATAYGMEMVAEGVETVEQACGLRAMGVDHLQGFLFARPEPIEHLVGRLRASDWIWDVHRDDLQVPEL